MVTKLIDDLDNRRKHWDEPRNRAPRDEHDLTDSLPYPYTLVMYLLVGKNAMEIGPGRGRQYERLREWMKSYAICDISLAALDEPVFIDANDKFLLTSYSCDFKRRFDVVHFWYVLHHIKNTEKNDFFAFVARHLVPGGYAIFNTPQSTNKAEWYADDGMGTSWTDAATVNAVCSLHLTVLKIIQQNDRSSGCLFVARKE